MTFRTSFRAVGFGSSVIVALLLGACRSSHPGGAYDEGRIRSEPASTTETTAAVVQHADAVTHEALDEWSKVPPPEDAPAAPVEAPNGESNTASPAGVDKGENVPPNGVVATPPRSASEAAERHEPLRDDPSAPRPVYVPGPSGAGGSAPTTPTPVQPTAPAETRNPLR